MKIPSFILFFICYNIYSQSYLKIGEVYDYDIGDEFHYEMPHAPSNADRVIITNKTFSLNLDTLCYERSHSKYTSTSSPVNYSFSSYVDNVCYTNLDSLIIDMDFITPDSNFMWYDTIVNFDTLDYCLEETNGYSYAGDGFEPLLYVKLWGRGLGVIDNGLFHPGDPSVGTVHHTKLFYYKKGNVSCGTPDYSSVKSYEKEPFIKVFPNPIINDLNISTDNKLIETIKVYNSMGDLVEVIRINGFNSHLNFTNYSKGIYVLDVQLENRRVSKVVNKL